MKKEKGASYVGEDEQQKRKEVRIVNKAVVGYELEILTGPREAEEEQRAELTLLDEQGTPSGFITFYDAEVTLGPNFVNRAGRPMMQLHTEMLSSVLALLHGEKPVFVSEGRLTNTEDSSTV